MSLFYTSPVSVTILLVTISISLYCLYVNQSLLEKLMLNPFSIYNKRGYFTILTSGLIHADLVHLFFNMYSFQSFGTYLETVIGSMHLIIIYILSIIAGNISALLKNKTNFRYRSLGASGGVSGIIFSYIILFPDSKISLMFIPIGFPSAFFGIAFLIYSHYSAKYQYDNINHDAHLWGALTGLFVTVAFYPNVVLNLLNQVF